MLLPVCCAHWIAPATFFSAWLPAAMADDGSVPRGRPEPSRVLTSFRTADRSFFTAWIPFALEKPSLLDALVIPDLDAGERQVFLYAKGRDLPSCWGPALCR